MEEIKLLTPIIIIRNCHKEKSTESQSLKINNINVFNYSKEQMKCQHQPLQRLKKINKIM